MKTTRQRVYDFMNLPTHRQIDRARRALVYKDIGSEAALQKAEQRGLTVVTPTEYELFVDIDNDLYLERFNEQAARIKKYLNFTYEVKCSPSGEAGHYHIYCKLDRAVSHMERVLLQLLLGSDPVREFLSWALIVKGDPHPTLFFEKKEDNKPLPERSITFEE